MERLLQNFSTKDRYNEEPLLSGTTVDCRIPQRAVKSGNGVHCTVHNVLDNLAWSTDGKLYFITGTTDTYILSKIVVSVQSVIKHGHSFKPANDLGHL